jgi:chromosome segregation ATPase
VTGRLPELLAALDAVRRRIYGNRASLEESERSRARLLDELREAESELDELRTLLRAVERPPAAPTTQLRRRRSA